MIPESEPGLFRHTMQPFVLYTFKKSAVCEKETSQLAGYEKLLEWQSITRSKSMALWRSNCVGACIVAELEALCCCSPKLLVISLKYLVKCLNATQLAGSPGVVFAATALKYIFWPSCYWCYAQERSEESTCETDAGLPSVTSLFRGERMAKSYKCKRGKDFILYNKAWVLNKKKHHLVHFATNSNNFQRCCLQFFE